MPTIRHTASPYAGSPHVFIATPAASLHGNYVAALAASLPRMMAAGVAADYCLQTGNCHVDDARNAMVRQFLMTGCDALVFIDADVGWRPEDLIRLCRLERDMVAGIYPLKEDAEGYPVRTFPGRELWADGDGLVEVDGLPTGFLRISRAAVEKMVAAYGERKFWGRGQDRREPPQLVLFERTYENGVRYSGDYAFCRLWQRLGGKMYVDPEMLLSHAGEKEWSGRLGTYWKRAHGVLDAEIDARFDAAVSALRAGRADADTLTALCEGWRNPAWQAEPEFLAACWRLARKTAGPILECGSGLSTLVLALANPRAEVHALEHDPIWAQHARDVLLRYGVTNATVHLVPLADDHRHGRWYIPDIAASRAWPLAVIDGPPRYLSDRRAALAHIPLAEAATLLWDDCDGSVACACADAGLAVTTIPDTKFAIVRRRTQEAA